jgi:hypothetical protein
VNNAEAVSKAIATSNITTGVLSPDQAGAFIQKVFEATPMLSAARRVAMGAKKMNLDKLGVGSRILRHRAEGASLPGLASVAASQVQLDAVNLSLPWEITEDALRYNIEGERFEETVISLMTRQVGVDLNDLAWNGALSAPPATTLSSAIDAAAATLTAAGGSAFPPSGVLVIGSERIYYAAHNAGAFSGLVRGYDGTTAAAHADGSAVSIAPDWLLKALDGWLAQAAAGGAHLLPDAGDMSKTVLKGMLDAMPTRFLSTAAANRLRWIMHPRTAYAYYESLGAQSVSAGDRILLGADGRTPYGYPILEDAAVPTSSVVFTDPSNLVIGMVTDIRVSRDSSSKDVLSRGVRYYQIDLAADVKIEEPDAVVAASGVTV